MTRSQQNHRLDVSYVGSRYHGWQVQPGLPTIQGKLEYTLSKMYGMRISIIGSGRTDAGVHALNQVANYSAPSVIPIHKLARVLNNILPNDICITDAQIIPPSFHARKSATSKVYRYQVFNGILNNPFRAPFFHTIQIRLDIRAMQEAARFMVGTHNFRSFCSHADPEKNHIRTVFGFRVFPKGKAIFFRVEANGFLQHMVRNMVGTLLEAGRGKPAFQNISAIIQAGNRSTAGPTAPAKGLFLVKVKYEKS